VQCCVDEFGMTFKELADRTDVPTALHGIAWTVASAAHATTNPGQALQEFKQLLNKTFDEIERKKKK
jgi:predicted DNA-binding transcriptional regulator